MFEFHTFFLLNTVTHPYFYIPFPDQKKFKRVCKQVKLLKNDVTSIFMFTYTSIMLRMFQIEMPLVLAPHEDYYVPSSIYLRSRQTLNICVTVIP